MADRTEEMMTMLAEGINKALRIATGRHYGFVLIVSDPTEKNTCANFISNLERSSATEVLRITADRIENREDIPPSVGPMQ